MVADDHFFDTFPCRYSLRLLVCYRGHFSVYKTLEKVCIAISLRLTQNLSQNACTKNARERCQVLYIDRGGP